jgi:small conductance mechanosensitive channel
MYTQPFAFDPKDELFFGVTSENLAGFFVVLVVGLIVTKLVCRWLEQSLIKAKTGEILAGFTSKVANLLLTVFVVGTALAFLGIQIGAAMVSLSVVLGFVLGFALGDTLGNIASGFMLAINRPFEIGDYVTINGESGVVKALEISNTELDTVDNKRVIIPNKAVWGSNIINFTKNPIRRVDMQTGVSYTDNLNKVIEVTMEVLKSDSRILADPAPQVAVKEMADSSVNFVVRPWVKTADYWDVFFAMQKALKEAYDENEISIPFPQMDVHMET